MCVTNIYVDVYPDGKRREFRQTSVCQYGLPGRPCAKTSTLENPPRKIQWDELSTEYMFTQYQRTFPAGDPLTPPRSSGGSTHRPRSGGYVSSSDDGHLRRKDSKRRSAEPSKKKEKKEVRPKREHRKERIIIVDSPPTPRTPPQKFNLPYTAPNSPVGPRGRPIIVDERPRPRVPSVGAVVGDRPPRLSRSNSRPRFGWETPSSSHTSFDLQAQADDRAKAEAKARRDSRIAELEAEKARNDRIRAHDEDIKRRPAVPLPQRTRSLRPVVDQSEKLPGTMGGLRIDERLGGGERLLSPEPRRRQDEREIAAKLRQEAEADEALRQRLRERQMPGRRFSVGPAQRRQRVLYSDGVYRWE